MAIQIPDYPNRIGDSIIGGLGCRKTNSLFNIISHQPDIDTVYSYAKYPYAAKHHLLTNKKESAGLKHLNDSKDFIEYSNNMDDKNIEENNPKKKGKVLIVFGDMIADMLSNKKLNLVVTELFIRERKLRTSLVFVTQAYFLCQKM